MPSNVRVAVRVRPMLPHEQKAGHTQKLLSVDTERSQLGIFQQDSNTRKNYAFDKILDGEHSQQDVFEGLQVPGLIQKVVDGFHATIFAYGQTGSGKTFTMEGYEYGEADKKNNPDQRAGKVVVGNFDNHNNGITVRAIRDAFQRVEDAKKEKHISISCSFLQIYNEKVFDLLNSSKAFKNKNKEGLRIRWNKNDQFSVENLYVFKCNDAEHCMQYYNKGIKNKIVASHNLNHASSRSHCIFTLTFEITDNASVDNQVISKLQLVDLAGSERTSQTGATGLAQKESIDINKSLFTLRKVITGLAEAGRSKNKNALSHIPYRDSKLTCLLKQSLGGNSYALMIACLSPSDAFLEENISTLNYATKASFISNIPTKNEDPKMRMVNDLKDKVARLERELASANNHIQFLSQLTGQDPNVKPNQTAQSSTLGQTTASEPSSRGQENDIYATANQRTAKVTVQRVPADQMPATGPPSNNLISQGFNRLDQEQLSKKLIESVEMIKELHQSNKLLRDNVQGLYSEKDKKDSDNFVLQNENRDLRDRIEILENVVGAQTFDVNQDAWRDLLYPTQGTSTEIGDVEKVSKVPQPSLGLGQSQNAAVSQMAQELIEFRKGTTKQADDLLRLQTEKDNLSTQNMQLSQQNQVLQQQLMQLQEKQMRSNQLSGIYGGGSMPTGNRFAGNPGGKKAVPSNVNVGRPSNQKEALQMLNHMMHQRVGGKNAPQQRQPTGPQRQNDNYTRY